MSLVESPPLSRGQRSQFLPSLSRESPNQQVPGSPLSPFFLSSGGAGSRATAAQRNGIPCSPSSGSPLALVPDGGSPLLRRLLAGSRRRGSNTTPSPSSPLSSAEQGNRRDSPRVPNSIIVVKRSAPTNTTANKARDQVVPSPSKKRKVAGEKEEEEEAGKKGESEGNTQRVLPEVTDNTKLLDLFGGSAEIFASSREE